MKRITSQHVFTFTLSVALLSLVVPALIHAQAGFVPLADSQQSGLQNVYESRSLKEYINAIFKMAISLGAILAVMRLAWAGFQYMTTDAWGSKHHAKEVIGDVVLGLLLLLSIYLILNQINPDILSLDALRYVQPAPTGAN